MAIKHLLRFKKYPQYFTDIILIRFYKSKWSKQGVHIGRSTIFHGIPIITLLKNTSIEIGSKCLICSRSQQTALGINHEVIIRTLKEGAKIFIGNNVRMSGTTICASERLEIGDRCVIGADVIIADTDFHSLDPVKRSSSEDSEDAVTKPVTIGHDVFIGGRSIILKGVRIGNNSIIGAGSVVTKSFRDGSIIAGNPAVLIKNSIGNE